MLKASENDTAVMKFHGDAVPSQVLSLSGMVVQP